MCVPCTCISMYVMCTPVILTGEEPQAVSQSDVQRLYRHANQFALVCGMCTVYHMHNVRTMKYTCMLIAINEYTS